MQTPLNFAMLLSVLFIPSSVLFTPTLFIFVFFFFFCKDKREFSVYTRHEGSGGVAPRMLYLDTGGDWSVSRPFRFFFRKNAPGDN